LQDTAIEDLTVAEIMSTCPATIRLFIQWRLHCVGCPIAPFHTLCDAAREHGIPATDLIAAMKIELNQNLTGDRA
jgi:hybrid cluster-associated redox disulfide protein